MDELEKAVASKPQAAPRTRKLEPEKPVEEMTIDEMSKAIEEPESVATVKSPREIVESSEDEPVLWPCIYSPCCLFLTYRLQSSRFFSLKHLKVAHNSLQHFPAL